MLQELAPGSLVHGRFEVERLTGSGGMGAVYRAMDRTTMQPVAIKVLFDGADEARFHREALLLAELRHPGIVGYVAHGRTDAGHPFLAMQWLSGIDLAERLRHGGLNLKESLLLIQRVAEALSIAHKRGIIHRDIKPSNLFLVDGDPGKVVLLDFGIARRGLGVRSAAMTRTGAIIGTPEYMAPEQARGQSQLSAAADVFSLGCVFYECLAGSPPFVAAHVAAVLAKILFEDAPKLRTVRPELPLPLEDLLLRMLHKDPKLRPADGGAVLAALLLLPTLPTLQGPAFEHAVVGPSIRGSEQQLVSVLLVSDVLEVSSQQTLAEADDAAQKARLEALRAHLAPSGLHLEQLVDGSLLGTMHQLGSGAATDLAGRAARAALHIHERWSEAVVAIATGKGMLAGDLPVGEAVDRAAVLLRRRTTAGGTHAVLIDELTAGLLDARFEVVRLSHGAFALLGERLSIDESRKLLGKPTPCVGREQELLAL
ncbi:MAG TPA: serine/threonine-protein kinase, partial [Pseudomonadota bacterium]|nr:serine/threonine-protein kinase [Pseudomonadota bacterium]